MPDLALGSTADAGYAKEWPAERFLRDSWPYDIGAGTNDVRRFRIGPELVGGR